MSKSFQTFNEFVANLEQIGLNLCAAFDLNTLPQSIIDTMPTDVLDQYKSLLLVGTKGSAFWQHLKDTDSTDGHCFDEMSQTLTLEVLNKHYSELKTLLLYPNSDYVLPLQQLGHRVGWGRPSVLGLDIHPEFGTWFAYRTAIVVSEELPQTKSAQTKEVCEICVDKPCLSACPVAAVKTIGQFDITACMNYRTKDNSPCAGRCLSRLSCPVGEKYYYQKDHLAHHGRFSLASIKRYKENNKW